MPSDKRRVLIIGGGFSGLLAARDLAWGFDVTVVDAKEFFEYTPGILRAYVKPAHFEALSFNLGAVLEKHVGVKFIWGEAKEVDVEKNTVSVKQMFSSAVEKIGYDYLICASGCNFNFLHKWGESLWFPTIYEEARPHSQWPHLDERFMEGRRRHIMEEYTKIKALNDKGASILVAGAGFIGVEWATELQHFFPKLDLTIIDFLPNCLGPLPKSAQTYCENYMSKVGIKMHWGVKYEPNNPEFWKKIGLPNGADETYVCMGVKASNYFMPKNVLSDKGPGGGGWIVINKKLQVVDKVSNEPVGAGNVFAIGDCNFGCVGTPDDWKAGRGMAPVPKISYPSEEQAVHAIYNIRIMDKTNFGPLGYLCDICLPETMMDTWWPWGAGMFATSLGPDDACFVLAANSTPGSGMLSLWGWCSAIQKEIIESSKVDECKHGIVGQCIWYFVHHTYVHFWGEGAFYK